jgi:general stress protein YciG
MGKTAKELLRAYLSKLGKRGGKARAKKYDKKTLSTWAKKGGRPRKGGAEKRCKP